MTCGSLVRAALTALAVTTLAASPALAGPQEFRTAQRAFYSLEDKARFEVAILLMAAGVYNGTSTGEFGPRLFRGIQDYQASLGHPQTGYLTGAELASLRVTGYGAMAGWGMTEVVHPYTDAKLYIPTKAAPQRNYTKRGLAFESYDNTISVDYSFFSASESSLESLYARMSSTAGGKRVDYKVIRPAFFVVAGGYGDRGVYTRYQIARGGIVGFTLAWDSNRVFRGDRIAVLMSNLFLVPLGGYGAPAQAAMPPVYIPEPAPVPAAPPAPAPTPAVVAPPVPPAPPPAAPKPELSGSSGTGFFVSAKRMLTNAHVVEGCEAVTISVGQTKGPGRVLARDKANDLAVLETDTPHEAVAKLRSGVKLGEDVAAFGYPLRSILTTSGNFTRGGITATAGMRDNSGQLQISAPIQPGNSGGPLLDEAGNVVGVVVGKLRALEVALAVTDGDLPQNVNFAIKASVAQTFLEANGTEFEPGVAGEALKPADLAARAQSFSGLIECKP